MRTATVRDLRNDFARVSRWIRNGEAVTVTRDGRPFATLSPWTNSGPAPAEWPDLGARRSRIFKRSITGPPVSEIVSEQRGEH